MGLPDGVKSLTICLAVLIECTNVTDRQTDRQTQTDIHTHTRHRMTAKAALDASIARQKLSIQLSRPKPKPGPSRQRPMPYRSRGWGHKSLALRPLMARSDRRWLENIDAVLPSVARFTQLAMSHVMEWNTQTTQLSLCSFTTVTTNVWTVTNWLPAAVEALLSWLMPNVHPTL